MRLLISEDVWLISMSYGESKKRRSFLTVIGWIKSSLKRINYVESTSFDSDLAQILVW